MKWKINKKIHSYTGTWTTSSGSATGNWKSRLSNTFCGPFAARTSSFGCAVCQRCVCTYICIYVHTHTRTYTHMCGACVCVCVCVCACVCVCVCVCSKDVFFWMRCVLTVCVCARVCVCVSLFTCMHTCIYYICIYMCIRVCLCIYRCYTSMPFDSRTPRHIFGAIGPTSHRYHKYTHYKNIL